MSTFSGLSTALTALTAQRQALEVAGQNIANANTVGYTRQRAELQSVGSGQSATMFSQGSSVGNGVQVGSISRLGDLFLDARVRTTTSSSAFLATRAEAFSRLESTIAEPGKNGIAKQLDDFWATWQDVSNNPTSAAAGQVVIESALSVQRAISTGYSAVATQWDQTRTKAEALVSDINTTAASVAELNEKIRSITVSGGNANELIDQRNVLTTALAGLAGATVKDNPDGTADVSIGGNAIVSGIRAQQLKLAGGTTMVGATGTNAVSVEWDRTPGGSTVSLTGGELAGVVRILAPADAAGTGGLLAEAASSYNALATSVATQVNAFHTDGVLNDGTAGGPVFDLGGGPVAITMTVAITDPAQIAAGTGGTDGSIADKISQIGSKTGSPDELWSSFVVSTGVKAKAATQSAIVAETARATADNLQIAQTSVDLDEESVNMLAFQRSYQGAARVMTAIDEMLDQLINRTGVVGR